MTYLSKIRLNVTCTASNASYQTEEVQGGYLYAVRFTKASASAIASGATCVISAVGVSSAPDIAVTHDILTFVGTSLSQIVYPRRDMQTTAGVSNTTLGGVMIPLVNDYIKLTVASGGASGKGTFEFIIEGR